MGRRYGNFINGAWTKPVSDRYAKVLNPFNQSVLAEVSQSDKTDVDLAVAAARKAFDSGAWSTLLTSERAKYLWRLADLLEKDILPFAKLESLNQGKTLKYSRDSDFPFIIDNLRFFAGAARILEGKAAHEYSGMGTSFIRREPIGVCAGIVPWNYPLYIAAWKFAPALAAGNTVVLKPASLTPLTLLEFAKLTKKAGIPNGVFNVVTGNGSVVGTALASHPSVDMVAFTGDTWTGKNIMQTASRNLKKVHLELGGKAPLIVLEDANLDMVAEGACIGGFWNAGQDCTAVTRVYVHKSQYNKLVNKMIGVARRFKLGNPLGRDTDMGPLISEKQRDRVESYIRIAVNEGAKIVHGGNRPKGATFAKGWFLEPTILTNVKHESRVCKEEIFGPVISVFPYATRAEAIQKANDVIYGLAASVYGSNISDCITVANQLHFGTVWINEHGVLTSETPHGGFKQSGFGKDLSMYSFEEYTQLKHVYIDLTKQRRRSWHYTVYGKK